MSTEPRSAADDGDDEGFRDGPLPAATRITKSSSTSVTMLSAAMIAVGEILEPEKANVEMEQPADSMDDDAGLDLSFGDLPPIEDL